MLVQSVSLDSKKHKFYVAIFVRDSIMLANEMAHEMANATVNEKAAVQIYFFTSPMCKHVMFVNIS